TELIPVILGGRTLQVIESRFVIPAIVENVRQVDAGFRIGIVVPQRLPEQANGGLLVAVSVACIAEQRQCFRVLRRFANCGVKKLRRLRYEPFTEKSTANLKNEVDVVFVAKRKYAPEVAQGFVSLAESEKRFTVAGQRVFVLGIENQGLLENESGPGVLFPCQPRIADPDVQFYRVRVERQALAKHFERGVILPFVVQLMRLLVVLFRAQERGGHISANLQR